MAENTNVATLFKQTIQAKVSRLSEAEVNSIVNRLITVVGMDSIEMTSFVRDADFEDFVRPVEARALKAAFESLSTQSKSTKVVISLFVYKYI